jgi:hypothetical protein
MTRHALHLPLLPRKQAHQQISLMERPSPQHNRLTVMLNQSTFSHTLSSHHKSRRDPLRPSRLGVFFSRTKQNAQPKPRVLQIRSN